MKTRNVKIAYALGWERSRIAGGDEGFYNDCTISLIEGIPFEVSNKELIERWDNVCLTKPGELRNRFHYHEILDAETTSREEYRVNEHNKGEFQ